MQHMWGMKGSSLGIVIVAALLSPVAVSKNSLRDSENQPYGDSREPGDKQFSELWNITYDASQSSGFARTAASDARAVSSEVMARLAADSAEGSQSESKNDKDNTKNRERFFVGAVEEGKKQDKLASEAVTAAKEAFEAGKIWQVHAVKVAAKWATQETQRQLASTFKGLQDWKYEVLHSPVSEAAMAAQKAAAPYENAMRTLEKRIAEMSQRATGLQSQAYALQNEAQGLAGSAVAQQAAKDFKGAQQSMADAHQMMAQASLFGAQAQKIEMAIEPLEVPLPAYSAAAQAAAASAAHRYNKPFAPPNGDTHLGYAAPPVSPKAFNPPPPPVPILLSRHSEVHRMRGPVELAIGA